MERNVGMSVVLCAVHQVLNVFMDDKIIGASTPGDLLFEFKVNT